MTWTTPRTWVTGEVLTATDLNTHLRDNLDALKAPPTAHNELDESSNYTTTSVTFVDIDATNLSLTIETTGGDVLVGFVGSVMHSTSGAVVLLDLDVDGSRLADDDGFLGVRPTNSSTSGNVSFVYLVTGLSAGSHTFKLQWRVTGGTATMHNGAGTANADVHPQFWAREVS